MTGQSKEEELKSGQPKEEGPKSGQPKDEGPKSGRARRQQTHAVQHKKQAKRETSADQRQQRGQQQPAVALQTLKFKKNDLIEAKLAPNENPFGQIEQLDSRFIVGMYIPSFLQQRSPPLHGSPGMTLHCCSALGRRCSNVQFTVFLHYRQQKLLSIKNRLENLHRIPKSEWTLDDTIFMDEIYNSKIIAFLKNLQ